MARVLRDSDKKDSLGPWGTLRHINHHFHEDFVPTKEILESARTPLVIAELANRTLTHIKENPQIKERYLPVLDYVLEWVDDRMLDFPESYDFLKDEYDFTKSSREFLLSQNKS